MPPLLSFLPPSVSATLPGAIALLALYGAVRGKQGKTVPLHAFVARRTDLVRWSRGLSISLSELADCCGCGKEGRSQEVDDGLEKVLDSVDEMRKLDQLGKRGTEWAMARKVEEVEKRAFSLVRASERDKTDADSFRQTAYAQEEVLPTLSKHMTDLMHNRGLGS